MASDIPTIKAKIQQERDVVAGMLASIDIPAEQALMATAQATYDADPAHLKFQRANQRWSIVNEKVQRLAVLDAQIALFTP